MTYGQNINTGFKRRNVDHKTWMAGSKNRVRWGGKSDHSDNHYFSSLTFSVKKAL